MGAARATAPPARAAAARRSRDAARLATRVGDRLAPLRRPATDARPARADRSPTPRTTTSPTRLSRLAALLAQPLGIRVATVDADGDFDTHDNQPDELDGRAQALSQALAAFQADLEARGLADRVLTLVWSEFGRRPQANESARHRPRRRRPRLGPGHARAPPGSSPSTRT